VVFHLYLCRFVTLHHDHLRLLSLPTKAEEQKS
jgi:hypothetical protein